MKSIYLLLFALLVHAAHASDDIIFPAKAQPSPAEKTLVVVAPGATEEMASVGQEAWAALSINMGTVTGLRALFIPFHFENTSIAIEGIYGISIHPISSLREIFGGGVRASITIVSDGRNGALLMSPGVDVLFASGTPGRGMAEYSAYGHIYFVGTSVELSWVAQLAKHFGLELGVRVGAAVVINDGNPKRSDGESLRGRVTPDLSVFTGVRF